MTHKRSEAYPGLRVWAVAAVVAAGLGMPARAQDPDDLKRGVARISLINNEVSVQRGDSGDWVAASLNAPMVSNDRISTSPNSRAEVQFDSATALRIGGDALVTFSQLEFGRYQMAVARGTVTFRVLRASNTEIEVDTPSVSLRPSKQGAYRISVSDAGETEITARSGGEVEVFTAQGSQWVRARETMMVRGAASDPEFQVVSAIARDDWDRWNDARDQALSRSTSAQYVGPGVYGAEDLDPYGTWVDVPGYGYAWHPVVAVDWAPYRQGRWVWEDWYGWTWVSYEPWGWAPYHYGRWFYQPAFGWCWYPGAVAVRHYWSPGLVAFFGFGGGVGVGVGFGNVGWVPLAPYEVLHPWWGRGYYGGPGYVNRSFNITNINITANYRNARAANGMTAVSGTDFQGGRFGNYMHVSSEQVREASLVRGAMPIAPERANLRYSDRQGSFVPRPSTNTRMFTRQQPSPAASVPFSEQRRAFDQTAGAGRSGVGREPTPAGGWQRFGETRNSTPGAASRTEAVTPPASSSGWNRFGTPSGTTPQVLTTHPSRSGFREQPSGGGSAQPSYSAPRQAAPPAGRPSGGGYSAPRGNSGGSRGSSNKSSGHGGGHNR